MSERHCPRWQYLPVKAQVSQWWWMEASLSASPTTPPHSHIWPVSSGCVEGRNVTKARHLFPQPDSRLFIFLWTASVQPSPPLFSRSSPSCFISSEISVQMDGFWGGWVHRSRTGGKMTSDHEMPFVFSATVRVHVENTCFTVTLAVLCLMKTSSLLLRCCSTLCVPSDLFSIPQFTSYVLG